MDLPVLLVVVAAAAVCWFRARRNCVRGADQNRHRCRAVVAAADWVDKRTVRVRLVLWMSPVVLLLLLEVVG